LGGQHENLRLQLQHHVGKPVLQPDADTHQLEAIAGRMGVSSIGRHTALGDAIMTGEVFLRMIPLLGERGIRTLGEAREAAQTTYQARIEYWNGGVAGREPQRRFHRLLRPELQSLARQHGRELGEHRRVLGL
jgi:DNA polymerase III epsilon subunit-like protein